MFVSGLEFLDLLGVTRGVALGEGVVGILTILSLDVGAPNSVYARCEKQLVLQFNS